MIKKIFVLTLICLQFLLPTRIIIKAEDEGVNQNVDITLNGTSGLLMDYLSGQIIIAKDIDHKLYPASMTKMMGMYLVMDAIQSGKIQKNQMVNVSAKASSMGGSQIYLEENEKMSVDDLFKSVCIASANDAMYALGETIAGSNDLFVQLMNKTAKDFQMTGTNFANVAGYDDPNHYTTARDMALLARQLLLKYGTEVTSYTSMLEGYVREDSEKPFWLVNTNKLIASYEGMDGLKTGYTNLSGYCLTATANRNNLRLIAISMKCATIADRSEDIRALLDYGFATYKSEKIYSKDSVIASTKFANAKEEESHLLFNSDVYIVLKKSDDVENVLQSYHFYKTSAPIKAQTNVGTLTLTNPDGWLFTYDFMVENDVNLLKWYDYFFKVLKDIFF